MMEYREFVEELMAEIKDETGLKAEFHEADEKMPQDSIWVYMSEDDGSSNIVRLFTAESYNQWTQRKTTFPALIRMIEPEDLVSVLDDTIKESTPEGDVLTKHCYGVLAYQ